MGDTQRYYLGGGWAVEVGGPIPQTLEEWVRLADWFAAGLGVGVPDAEDYAEVRRIVDLGGHPAEIAIAIRQALWRGHVRRGNVISRRIAAELREEERRLSREERVRRRG